MLNASVIYKSGSDKFPKRAGSQAELVRLTPFVLRSCLSAETFASDANPGCDKRN